MKIGDILNIKGSLGFLYNPSMKVIEIKDSLVLLESVDAKQGGLLSEFNQSWHGIDEIKKRL